MKVLICRHCGGTFEREKAQPFCSHRCRCLANIGRMTQNLPPRQDPEERFWATVKKTDGCWEWQGRRYRNRYGGFFFIENGRRRYRLAHRQAWLFTHGTLPEDMLVCHHCDNPPCVNPAHLFLGTTQDNIRDKVHKGRSKHARGYLSARTRFTEEDVKEFRREYAAGSTPKELATRHVVPYTTMLYIVKEITWRHLLENA